MLKDLEFIPLTAEEWEDLKRLFNENHRFNGCWCMYWRIERKDFDRNYGEENQRRLRRIVEACPLISENGRKPSMSAYMGLYSTFVGMGFREVARRSKIRPVCVTTYREYLKEV